MRQHETRMPMDYPVSSLEVMDNASSRVDEALARLIRDRGNGRITLAALNCLHINLPNRHGGFCL